MSKVTATVTQTPAPPPPPPTTFDVKGLTQEDMMMMSAILGAAADILRDSPSADPQRNYVQELFHLFSRNGGSGWTYGAPYMVYNALHQRGM